MNTPATPGRGRALAAYRGLLGAGAAGSAAAYAARRCCVLVAAAYAARRRCGLATAAIPLSSALSPRRSPPVDDRSSSGLDSPTQTG
jgi:hypothetical protein